MAWKQTLLKVSSVGLVLVQYGCVAHCTLEFVANFMVCSGPSMQPMIHPSDIVLTEHITIHRRRVERGDIVIARSPTNPQQHICKRVVALEGDWVEKATPSFSQKYIPRGHVWLEGDNKENSTDSRNYGPVPYGLLRSRVFFKVWPVRDFGSLSR